MGSRVVVLDGDTADLSWLSPALSALSDRGVDVRIVGRDDVVRYLLTEVAPDLSACGSQTLVVGLGLQKIPDIDSEVPIDPTDDSGFAPTISASGVLRELAIRGSTKQTYFVGWWTNVRALGAHLGYEHGGVRSYVLLKLGLDDVRSIVGPHATRVDESPRAILFDRQRGEDYRIVVPFEPITDAIVSRCVL